MYQTGRGVAADESRAVQLFQKGCEWGYAVGCTSLGAMYSAGRGVIKGMRSRAAQLYQKRLRWGYAVGCTGLGARYADGRGVTKDDSRAVQLYQKGCDGGYAVGCTSLGAMYATGGRGGRKMGAAPCSFIRRGATWAIRMGAPRLTTASS